MAMLLRAMSDEHLNLQLTAASRGAQAGRRLVSLDVLRGLAVLLMIFAGLLPKTLPNWLDHGYQPHFRPDASGAWRLVLDGAGNAVFDPRWKAFTWVDLVFPMFLFAMGVAIPQALAARRACGATTRQLVLGIVGRWLTLMLFAVLVVQLTPAQLAATDPNTRAVLPILGTVLAFLFFTRWPREVPTRTQAIVRGGALLAIVALVTAYAIRAGQSFHWGESDVIILVLAHTYLLAALACVAIPRARPRLAVLLPIAFVAHYVAIDPTKFADWLWVERLVPGAVWTGELPRHWINGWAWLRAHLVPLNGALNVAHWGSAGAAFASDHPRVGRLLDLSPLWSFTWYKFLGIVAIGTAVGGWADRWTQRRNVGTPPIVAMRERTVSDRWLPLAMAVLVCVAVFVGLRHYGYPLAGVGGPLRTPWLAPVLALPLLLAMGLTLVRGAVGDRRIERPIFKLAAWTLVVGLMLCCLPIRGADGTWQGGVFLEGGISKGPPATLSYYATSLALSALLLVGLFHAFDARGSRGHGIVAAVGQNPLMAYFIGHALLGTIFGSPLLDALGRPLGDRVHTLGDVLGDRLRDERWLQAGGAALKTLLLAIVVWTLTRLRIVWRA